MDNRRGIRWLSLTLHPIDKSLACRNIRPNVIDSLAQFKDSNVHQLLDINCWNFLGAGRLVRADNQMVLVHLILAKSMNLSNTQPTGSASRQKINRNGRARNIPTIRSGRVTMKA
jgi:hypothetical protein